MQQRGLRGVGHVLNSISKGLLLVQALSSGFAGAASLLPQSPQGFGGVSSDLTRLREATEAVERQAPWNKTRDLENQLIPYRIQRTLDGIGSTRFQHFYKGLEVDGSVTIHAEREGRSWVRNELRPFALDVRPSLSTSEALALSRSFNPIVQPTAEPELKVWPRADAGTARLVYVTSFAHPGARGEGDQIVVDAHSGKLVAELTTQIEAVEPAPYKVTSAAKRGVLVTPVVTKDAAGKLNVKECSVENLKTGIQTTLAQVACLSFLAGRSPLLTNGTECQVISGANGFPMVLNVSACRLVANRSELLDTVDPSAARARDNTEKALAYFLARHGRNGFDDKGTEVLSVIHAGHQMANAFWDTKNNLMAYGDGDGVEMGDLTLSGDVAGHEMTHGVVTATANLKSVDEAGAINEALADYFGSLIEGNGDWVMGSALYLTQADGTKARGLRDLANPSSLVHSVQDGSGVRVKAAYPAHLKDAMRLAKADDACTRQNDRCWVHHNSTVLSHATYRLHEALGQDKTEKLLMAALIHNMGPSETFTSAAQAIRLAAEQLEFSERDRSSVDAQLRAVGL